jgi:RNase P subunit RPR2
MGMWRCQVCGSDNRENDDYETFVRIICRDCGAIHDYDLREVTKVNEDGAESDFDWRKEGFRDE